MFQLVLKQVQNFLLAGIAVSSIGILGVGLSANEAIYVAVGDPDFKKTLIAVGETESKSSSLKKVFRETLKADLGFMDIFSQLPESKIPKQSLFNLGRSNVAQLRAVGVKYFIRSEIQQEAQGVVAKYRLIDVSLGKEIKARKIPYGSKTGNPARQLAHFAANEIVEAITGNRGFFRSRVLASCGYKNKEIYIMDYNGQNIAPLTQDRNFALSPSWSADGKRVLFTSYRPTGKKRMVNPNLYMFNIVTRKRTLVTAARGVNSGAVFHPKLERIAYTYSNKGKPEIFVLDLVKKLRIPITRTQFFSVEPDWSPDGNRLTFSSSKTGRPHIYVSRADGSQAKQLTKTGVYNSSPKWNPQGTRIVFSGQETLKNNFNIFMIDPNGSNLHRLTDGKRYSSENPVFSPDGRFIMFSSNRDGLYRLYAMSMATGKVSPPLTPKKLGHCKQPAWSPRL